MADTVRVKIEIQNGEAAVKTLTEIANLCDRINGKSTTFRVDSSNLRSLNTQLKEVETTISKMNREQINPQINTSGVDRLISGLQTVSSIASGIGSAFSGMNSALAGIGNAFTGMSDLFSIDLLNTSKRYLTAMATRMVTESLGDVMTRYDILSTFTPYMQIAGVDASTSNAALQRVNQSILGLPIGLDEAAYRLRRYQMFVGDTEQATNLTIGLQNALTAGGASQSMKNTAYMEMERLLTSGDLATWRQWQALITGFGVSSRFIADAMSEISGKEIDVKELARGLHDGSVSADDLLRAIEYLGKDWSEVPDNLVPKFVKDMNSALDVYKGTIEAWVSNIKFAVTRGGANVLTALNETLMETEDMSVTGGMENIRNFINDIFAGASEYIRGNPQQLSNILDMIGGLMDRLKGFGWGSFAGGVVNNLGRLFDVFAAAFDSIPKGALEEFASFAITIAGPAGTLIKTMQAGLPQMLAVFKAFHDFDFGGFMQNVTTHLGVFTNVVGGFLRLFNNDIASNIAAFALVWGPSIVKVAEGLSSAISFMTTGAGASILSFLLSNPITAVAAGGAALVGAWAYGEYQWELENEETMRRRTALVNGPYDNSEYATEVEAALESFNGKKEQWQQATQEIDSRTQIAETLMRKIRNANDGILNESLSDSERSKLRTELAANVAMWNDMFPDMALELYGNAAALNYGTLTEGSALFLSNKGKDFLELQNANDQAEAIRSVRQEAMEEMVKRDVERKKLVEDYGKQQQHVRELSEQYKALSAQAQEMYDNRESPQDVNAVSRRAEQTKLDLDDARATMERTRELIDETGMAYDEAADYVERYNLELYDYIAISDKLSKQDYTIDGETKKWEQLTEAQQTALENYEAYKEETGKTLEKAFAGNEAVKDIQEHGTNKIGEATANTQGNVTKLNYRQGRVEEANAQLEKLRRTDVKTYNQIKDAVAGLYEVVGQDIDETGYIFELADLLSEGNVDKLVEYADALNAEAEGIVQLRDALALGFGNLTGGGQLQTVGEENPELIPGWDKFNADLNELIDEGLPALGEAIGNAAPQLEPFVSGIGSIASEADDAKENVDGTSDAVSNLGSKAALKQGAVDNFAGSVGNVGNMASAAEAAVDALRATIDSLHDKTITINARVHAANVSGIETTGHFAELYASGGEVFGPGGIDNVPAMLTAGEFVIKRDAAKRFGPTFLEKVNGMDIGGAFDTLMHNLARPAGLGFMPNVTYNRDNHAQVTINNNGETGQGYSQRKAYAWASKL